MCKNRSNLRRFISSILALVVTVNFIISIDMIYNPRLISQCRYTVYILWALMRDFFLFSFFFFLLRWIFKQPMWKLDNMYILEKIFYWDNCYLIATKFFIDFRSFDYFSFDNSIIIMYNWKYVLLYIKEKIKFEVTND